MIAEEGVHGLNLREAARRAGVSTAAPYRHFQDKSELLAAVAEEGYRAVLVAMTAARAEAAPHDRLAACGRAYLRFAVMHPTHFRVMYAPELADKAPYPALRAAAEAVSALITSTVAESPRLAGDVNASALAAWSAVHGLAHLVINGQVQPGLAGGVEELARSVLAALGRGLRFDGR
jgi:AcrR family transcriptional regulator